MATPVAATTQIPFLNLQYFYCLIAGIFGKGCDAGVGVGTTTLPSVDIATTTIPQSGGGFWSWLWPFGSSGGSGGAGVGGSGDVGFWASFLNDAFPEPVRDAIISIGSFFAFLWGLFSWVSYSVSGLLLLVIVGSVVGLVFIRLREWGEYGTLPARDPTKSYGWSRWQDLLDEVMATDPKRWKAAIIAADGMLGELLTRIGYHGETTGEQMRTVPEDAFVTVAAAWEAHRIKNFIAARSSNYILTQREAFRVMKLYEQVFEEFDFI